MRYFPRIVIPGPSSRLTWRTALSVGHTMNSVGKVFRHLGQSFIGPSVWRGNKRNCQPAYARAVRVEVSCLIAICELLAWRKETAYSEPGDWVFASEKV